MKLLFLILLCNFCFSQSEKTLSVFEPIFYHKTDKKKFEKTYENYEEYSLFSIDSLFSNERKKYCIREKIKYKKVNLKTKIENEINKIFISVKNKNNDYKNIKLKSILNKIDNRYILFIKINTKAGYSMHNHTPMITKISIETIILDKKKFEIFSYEKSNKIQTVFNISFIRAIIKALDHNFNKMNLN